MNGWILRTVLLYATLSTAWIFFSDKLVSQITTEPERMAEISVLKGWVFVVVTSLLLWTLLRRVACARSLRTCPRSRWGLKKLHEGFIFHRGRCTAACRTRARASAPSATPCAATSPPRGSRNRAGAWRARATT